MLFSRPELMFEASDMNSFVKKTYPLALHVVVSV